MSELDISTLIYYGVGVFIGLALGLFIGRALGRMADDGGAEHWLPQRLIDLDAEKIAAIDDSHTVRRFNGETWDRLGEDDEQAATFNMAPSAPPVITSERMAELVDLLKDAAITTPTIHRQQFGRFGTNDPTGSTVRRFNGETWEETPLDQVLQQKARAHQALMQMEKDYPHGSQPLTPTPLECAVARVQMGEPDFSAARNEGVDLDDLREALCQLTK